MCYECDGKLQYEACHRVTFCDYDESCFISEESRFGEKFYRNGCQDKSLCQTVQYPYPVVGKRSVQREKCCKGDLCNSNFNDLSQSSILSTTTIYTTSADVCSMQSPCHNGATCKHQNRDKEFLCNCTEGFYGDTCQYSESEGTSFILLFTEVFDLRFATPKALVTSCNGGLYKAYSFGNNLTNEYWTLQPNQSEFALNHNVYMTDGIKHAGVELKGNKPTSVFGFNYNKVPLYGYSGGYLAIPTHFLSRTYIIPSFKPYNNVANSCFALTPVEKSATVNIQLKTESGSLTFKKRQYSHGENITAVIAKYETLELSHSHDLTGTYVTSSSPLAVVSGNKCNYIEGTGSCNNFIEMVLPVENLDQVYIVPHIETRDISTVRLLSLISSTITIKNTNNSVMVKQNTAREFLDFNHSTISYVNASSDISITIYPHEIANSKGDAFMMTIHGVNQYLPHYNFVVPKGFTSFISVTVLTNELNGFMLDGHIVTIDSVFTLSTGSGSYSSFSKSITSAHDAVC
ncbi:uncharacterized protein LOC143059405 [Mytilus galloprovincialis]|uniref:uncharacterized protein LOC143059405 n=1 Tax=Mytilus galloprovincialis TaxID=29158 RepID=UPI003F7B4D19